MADRLLLRRDSAANWTTANPVLALGEPGYDETGQRLKMGDGVTPWASLPYVTNNVGSVASVNGHSGAVTLAASDVGADTAGAAASAQAAADAYADGKAAAEVTRADGKYVAATGLDTATAAVITPGGSATAAAIAADPALRAAFVPKWKANTAYVAGEFVLNPSGQIVSANTAFTSGATYSSSNWTVVSGGGGGAGALLSVNNLSDVASAATARTNLGLGSAATQPTTAFDAAGAAAAAQTAAQSYAAGVAAGLALVFGA